MAAIFAAGSPLAVKADPAIPDPCKLVTVAEIQQLVGPLKGAPRQGDIASLMLRVSLPKGPKAVDTAKAIATKALIRL